MVEDNYSNPDASSASQAGEKTPAVGTSKSPVSKGNSQLGGISPEPCFCMLDGFEHFSDTRVTIPITRLPAILGRSHDSKDANFFGLGDRKGISRNHIRISYRDAQGGQVVSNDNDQLVYQSVADKDNENQAELVTTDDLPARGFFVVECLGKNRVWVDGQSIEKGKSVILKQATSMALSSYLMYFLTPTDAKPKEHIIEDESSTRNYPATAKKRKSMDSTDGGSVQQTPGGDNKRSRRMQVQDEVENMSTDQLLAKMTEAVAQNKWERKHGVIGATIAVHAVLDCAKDPAVRKKATEVGISRSEVMKWIEASPKYKEWVEQMHTKMETRSYQASITKCLLKAGYTRTGTSGRYIKWLLPGMTPSEAMKAAGSKSKGSKTNDGNVEESGSRADSGNEEEEEDDEEEEEENDADNGQDDDKNKSEGGEEEGEEEANEEDIEEDVDDGAEEDAEGDKDGSTDQGAHAGVTEDNEEGNMELTSPGSRLEGNEPKGEVI